MISKGSDCGVIDVESAYVTFFGNGYGGGGKAIIPHTSIDNFSYHKDIHFTHKNNQSTRAIPTNSWWQYDASAIYEAQIDSTDILTIVDQMIESSLV